MQHARSTYRTAGLVAAVMASHAVLATAATAALKNGKHTVDTDTQHRGTVDISGPPPAAQNEGFFMSRANWSWWIVRKDLDGDGSRDDIVARAYHKVDPHKPPENAAPNEIAEFLHFNVAIGTLPAPDMIFDPHESPLGHIDFFQIRYDVLANGDIQVSVGLDHQEHDPDDLEQITGGDCNGNGIPDQHDIDEGTSEDCNGNGTPDECESDGNGNGVPDDCDAEDGTDEDCNGNMHFDEGDIAFGYSEDGDGDGAPDECGTPCPGDVDGDGFVGLTDLVAVILAWGGPDAAADADGDGMVSLGDLLLVILSWGACG